MTMTRRDFLGTTLAVTASTAFAPPTRAATPLKVLVIGGTGFLGPHTVRRLQERGHTVTLFNRGRTNPGLFPDLEKLRGGPDVTFDGLMPRPGRYRAWTQFRRNNTVHTFSYTFTVQ